MSPSSQKRGDSIFPLRNQPALIPTFPLWSQTLFMWGLQVLPTPHPHSTSNLKGSQPALSRPRETFPKIQAFPFFSLCWKANICQRKSCWVLQGSLHAQGRLLVLTAWSTGVKQDFRFSLHQMVFSFLLVSSEKGFIIRGKSAPCHHWSFPTEPFMAQSPSETTLAPWKHRGGFSNALPTDDSSLHLWSEMNQWGTQEGYFARELFTPTG